MAHHHSAGFLKIVDDARSRIRETDVDGVKQRLDRGEKLFLIDVREESEFAKDHLPGATHLGKGIIERDIEEKIRALVASARVRVSRKRRRIEIPVCYDADFALDLARVEAETNLSADMIIALHSSAEFVVACVGFMPGFPFLAGLPEKLRTTRLATPRTKVPAGSVAIARTQAGVYPVESPGGWNLIGRTPLRLFDANANPPALLQAGYRVRFRGITRNEFEARVKESSG